MLLQYARVQLIRITSSPRHKYCFIVADSAFSVYRLVPASILSTASLTSIHNRPSITLLLCFLQAHGAFFGVGDLDRSPWWLPHSLVSQVAVAKGVAYGNHVVKFGPHASREQHVCLQYVACRRWNMGLGSRYVSSAQLDGCEL